MAKCICEKCAKTKGLVPKDKEAGFWLDTCDYCFLELSVTGRRDYRYPGQRKTTLEDIFLHEAMNKDGK